MGSIDVAEKIQEYISQGQVKDDVKNSLVYLDDGAGECAKTCLDFEFWISRGAKNVLRLEDASEDDKTSLLWSGRLEKLTIITTQTLSDAHRHILRMLRIFRDTDITSFSIYTTASEPAHRDAPSCPLPYSAHSGAFLDYLSLLCQDLTGDNAGTASLEPRSTFPRPWETETEIGTEERTKRHSVSVPKSGNFAGLGPRQVTVSVTHLGLLARVLGPSVFLPPPGTAPLDSGHSTSANDTAGEVDDLEDGLPASQVATAHWLLDTVTHMGFRVQPFCLGPASRSLGRFLSGLPSDMRPDAPCASVVLLDRDLDVSTPLQRQDTFLDITLYCAPRETATEPALEAALRSRHRAPAVTSAALFELSSAASRTFSQSVLSQTFHECQLSLSRWLRESLLAEGLRSDSKASLASLLHLLLSSWEAAERNLPLIQLAALATDTAQSQRKERWEAAASSARLITLLANGGAPGGVLPSLEDLLQGARDPAQLSEALILVAFAMVQSGTLSPEEESSLLQAMAAAVSRDRDSWPAGLKQSLETSAGARGLDDFHSVQLAAKDWAAVTLERLQRLAEERSGLVDRHSGRRSLVYDVAVRLLSREEVSGMEAFAPTGSAGAAGLFGRLGFSQARRGKPGDNSVILLFVVGGIVPSEIRDVIQAAVIGDKDLSLLFGGSSLLTCDSYGQALLGI